MSVWEKSFIKIYLPRIWKIIKPKPWEKDIIFVLFFVLLILLLVIEVRKQDYKSIAAIADKYKQEGDKLYHLAKVQFELKNYTEAASLCVKARPKYTETAFQFTRIKSIADKNKDFEFAKLASLNINISLAKYECCEAFEKAMINYENGNFERGNIWLNLSDEKIRLHDKFVIESYIALANIKNKAL